jgi:aliphatic nitrilase
MPGEDFPRVRLAAAQAAPVFLDRERTVAKACEIIQEAGAEGADLVGFPEGFIPGHPVWYYHYPATSQESRDLAARLFLNAVEVPSPATEALCTAARRANCYVVMGICERRPGTTGTMYNTQLYISRRGEILGKHQKLVPTVGERLVHAAGSGEGMRVFPSDFGPIGGLICGENSNPLALYVLAAQNMRVHVASWPHYFFPGWTKMVDTALLAGRNIAYMCKAFVISVCGTITEEMRQLMEVTDADRAYLADPKSLGGSSIIGPDGGVLAGPVGPEDQILYAEADLAETVRAKLVHDFAGHYQRHDIFRLELALSTPHLPHILPPPAAAAGDHVPGAFEPAEDLEAPRRVRQIGAGRLGLPEPGRPRGPAGPDREGEGR